MKTTQFSLVITFLASTLVLVMLLLMFTMITQSQTEGTVVCSSIQIPTTTPTATERARPTRAEFIHDPKITAVWHYEDYDVTPQPWRDPLPNGGFIDVRERTLCQDTDIHGSPRADSIVMGRLNKGDVINTHEWHDGWYMFKSARWIPEEALCQ